MQLNVVRYPTRFWNAPLDQKIYVKQPEGFKVNERQDQVFIISTVLYGLQQSFRICQQDVYAFLQSMAINNFHADVSLYTKCIICSLKIIVVYVDDLLISGDCRLYCRDPLGKYFEIQSSSRIRQDESFGNGY